MKQSRKPKECYTPSVSLLNYLDDKLEIEKKKQLLQDAGKAIPRELEERARDNKRMKVYVLDKIIFPSMANVLAFFEYVSKNPDLQELFDDDIKELLLGHKDSGPIIFRRLLEAILTWHTPDARKSTYKSSRDLNFRAELFHTMLLVAFHRVPSVLKSELPLQVVNTILINDLARAWAWTEILKKRTPNYDDEEASRKVQF